jgi:hypothetical protein
MQPRRLRLLLLQLLLLRLRRLAVRLRPRRLQDGHLLLLLVLQVGRWLMLLLLSRWSQLPRRLVAHRLQPLHVRRRLLLLLLLLLLCTVSRLLLLCTVSRLLRPLQLLVGHLM